MNPLGHFLGMKVIESHLAALPEPARKHRKTRHQSAAYHKRIQKKWNKRFGMVMKPAAFILNPRAAGLDFLGGPMLHVHPGIMGIIRNIGP